MKTQTCTEFSWSSRSSHASYSLSSFYRTVKIFMRNLNLINSQKRKARTKYTSYSILSRIRLKYIWLFSKPLSTPLKNYTLFLFEEISIAMCFFLHLTNTCTCKVQNTTPMFLYKLTLGKGNHSVTWWQPCKLSIFLDQWSSGLLTSVTWICLRTLLAILGRGATLSSFKS